MSDETFEKLCQLDEAVEKFCNKKTSETCSLWYIVAVSVFDTQNKEPHPAKITAYGDAYQKFTDNKKISIELNFPPQETRYFTRGAGTTWRVTLYVSSTPSSKDQLMLPSGHVMYAWNSQQHHVKNIRDDYTLPIDLGFKDGVLKSLTFTPNFDEQPNLQAELRRRANVVNRELAFSLLSVRKKKTEEPECDKHTPQTTD